MSQTSSVIIEFICWSSHLLKSNFVEKRGEKGKKIIGNWPIGIDHREMYLPIHECGVVYG